MSERTVIPQHADKPEHVHLSQPLVQMGWWGQTGLVYGLDEEEAIKAGERGGFSPIYAPWGETCGHQLKD